MKRTVVAAIVVAVLACTGHVADVQGAESLYRLNEFGPLDSSADIQVTFEKAVKRLREGDGGVLIVPGSAWRVLKPVSLQGLVREPSPPAETKRWRHGSGVTLIAVDARQAVVVVPPLDGARIERQLRLADGDSLPHWGTHPMLTLDSHLTYGSSSYLDWLQEPVAKGPNRRFYVPSVRGLWPGQFLNIHGGPGYGGRVTRAVVTSLGWDARKNMHYLVADSDLDHIAGAILHNKSNTGL